MPKYIRVLPIVEESHVDLANKTFTTYTRNVAWRNVMVRTQAHYVISPYLNISILYKFKTVEYIL